MLRDELGKNWDGCVMGRRFVLGVGSGPFLPSFRFVWFLWEGERCCCLLCAHCIGCLFLAGKKKNSLGAEQPNCSRRARGGHCAAPWAREGTRQCPSCLHEEPLPWLQGRPQHGGLVALREELHGWAVPQELVAMLRVSAVILAALGFV